MPRYESDTVEEVKPEVIVAGHEYDTPPKQWVAGTTYAADVPPEDMTDAEYIQWCFDNAMPYWAIKKEIYLRKPPVLSGLEPSTAQIGDASFDLKVSGTGLIPDSIIVFSGYDEPTQLNEDGTVSTGVNMGVWHGAATVPVSVRNGAMVSEPLEFTFTGGTRKVFKDYPPEPKPEPRHDDDDEKKKAKHKK